MGAIKSYYHDTIERSQRIAAKAPAEKCKKHKWTKEGIAYPYSMCVVCGQLKK